VVEYDIRRGRDSMPKIDIPIKRLFKRRPADWVKYILGEIHSARTPAE